MYTVYVLKLKGKKNKYIGVTSNIKRRLDEHVSGKVKSTRGRYQELLYTEDYELKSDAWKKESFFKSGQGRKWLDEKIMGR